jgi:hypothetical protein
MLGHASISIITLDTYSHVIEGIDGRLGARWMTPLG